MDIFLLLQLEKTFKKSQPCKKRDVHRILVMDLAHGNHFSPCLGGYYLLHGMGNMAGAFVAKYSTIRFVHAVPESTVQENNEVQAIIDCSKITVIDTKIFL